MTHRSSRYFSVAVGLLSSFLLLSAPDPLGCQEAEYDIKAEFLERFTRFIEWPSDSSVQDQSVPFVIGLFDNPFGDYLASMAKERKIKGKPVEIRLLHAPDDVLGCNMVYISASIADDDVAAILKLTADRSILTVGDAPGMAEKGALINFYTTNDHVRFEINKRAAERSGLKFSGRLLNLALTK